MTAHSVPEHATTDTDIPLQESLWRYSFHSSVLNPPLVRISELRAQDEYRRDTKNEFFKSCDAKEVKFQDDSVIVALLGSCSKQKDFVKGSRIHADICKSGLLWKNVYVGNALVNMYAKCGALAKAQEIFAELPVRDVVTWTALIAGCAQHGYAEEAVERYKQMCDDGILPNAVTFTSVLQACGSIQAIEKGEEIHAEIARHGWLRKDVMLGTALVDMYAKCGKIAKAQEVFDELPVHTVVSWNALITGYVQECCYAEALVHYNQMQEEGLLGDTVTFISVIKACGSEEAALLGEEIYSDVFARGLLSHSILLQTALVDMYAKCGILSKAQDLFDGLSVRDVVSWSALITGYVNNGHGEALRFFECMLHEGIAPNEITFTSMLKACGCAGAAEKGRHIHVEVVKQGLLEKSLMLGTALVDMYAKLGEFDKAEQLLDDIPVHDVIIWNVIINEYAQCGYGSKALKCLEWMEHEGLCPDALTLTSILTVCSSEGLAEKGEEMYVKVVQLGFLEKNDIIANALVFMYAKCGAFAKAETLLSEHLVWNVVSWSILIAGYAQHGHGDEALNCFKRMQCDGLSPDEVTLTVLLNACDHSGLLDEGEKNVGIMSAYYDLIPTLVHHVCMVDLFGRAGNLQKAFNIIKKIPSDEREQLWFTLLGACRKWGNTIFGRLAFEHVLQSDKKDMPVYVCMRNIYSM